jgi:hypothetical protein
MSNKKINENPNANVQGGAKLKSLGGQKNSELKGIQPQILAKAMDKAAKGEPVSGQHSQQLGKILTVLQPILSDSGALQRVLQLSDQMTQKTAQGQQAQQTRNPGQDPDSNYRADRGDNVHAELDDDLDIEELSLSEDPKFLNQVRDPENKGSIQQIDRGLDDLSQGEIGNKQDREAASGIIGKLRGMLDDETFGPRIVNLIKMYNKEKGQAMEPDMDAKPEMDADEPEMKLAASKYAEQMEELKKLAGLQEGLGYADPGEEDERVTYSKTKKQGDASVTVSANASSMDELQDILKLAGMEPQTDVVPGDANDEDPEEEELLMPVQSHDHEEPEMSDCCDDEECHDDCGDEEKPKMIVLKKHDMDKSSLFNSLKAKLQDKLSS